MTANIDWKMPNSVSHLATDTDERFHSCYCCLENKLIFVSKISIKIV